MYVLKPYSVLDFHIVASTVVKFSFISGIKKLLASQTILKIHYRNAFIPKMSLDEMFTGGAKVRRIHQPWDVII